MSVDMSEHAALERRLMGFILRGEGDFNALALEVFAWQHAHNAPYRGYCDGLGVDPGAVTSWRQIPTVPTDVFRFAALFCGDPAEATHTFRTSGTTHGQRGEHRLRGLALYHASALAHIDRLLLPDGPRPALMLAPSPEALPDSSLSSMLGLIAERRALGQATFAWGRDGLEVEVAVDWLTRAAADAQPVQVLSTTFAMVMLLDHMEAHGLTLALPTSSIVMLTGGTKGRTREVMPEEVEQAVTARLGVPWDHQVHEYGMTELGSQLYDPRLVRTLAGEPPTGQGTYTGPAWCRVTAHDPATLAEVAEGHQGLLRFTDLSNLDSVVSVQTSDLGRVLEASPEGDTVILLGRAPGAVARGCSLLIEETPAFQRQGQP